MRLLLRTIGLVAKLLAWVALLLLLAWCVAALWFDGPESRPLAGGLAAIVGVGSLASLALMRPRRVGVGIAVAVCLAVVAWWNVIPARNDRDWMPDVAQTPTAEIDGDRLTLHHVRDFDYRSEDDYTERWENRTYDLAKIRGVDLFLSYWGSPAIAHTIMSWDFGDGQHLAISIETRKEKGESYSALRGFFRQYELYYVVADERDVIRLRTNHRNEDVYLYRLRVTPETARNVLLDYLKSVNELAAEPVWYNAMTQNCTTTIRMHTRHLPNRNPLDWRLLVNGYIDEMLYERGTIDTSLPFAELKKRSSIDERAKAADRDPGFAERIREGVPG
jgi:hypothetical protein